MNVIEIVEKYLKENEYDGLCNDGCGCSIKEIGELCNGAISECEPAYRHTNADCSKCECDCDNTGSDNMEKECYGTEKPKLEQRVCPGCGKSIAGECVECKEMSNNSNF